MMPSLVHTCVVVDEFEGVCVMVRCVHASYHVGVLAQQLLHPHVVLRVEPEPGAVFLEHAWRDVRHDERLQRNIVCCDCVAGNFAQALAVWHFSRLPVTFLPLLLMSASVSSSH